MKNRITFALLGSVLGMSTLIAVGSMPKAQPPKPSTLCPQCGPVPLCDPNVPQCPIQQ